MFFLLRAALVIGAIFYFSPARHGSEGNLSFEALIGAATHPVDKLKETAAGTPQRLQQAWNALPESARQAVLDKILPQNASTGEALRVPRTDTLLPEDHRPAWTGALKKPGA